MSVFKEDLDGIEGIYDVKRGLWDEIVLKWTEKGAESGERMTDGKGRGRWEWESGRK